MLNEQNSDIDADQCAASQQPVFLLWSQPSKPVVATLILAHGAGAPMDSQFMEAIANRLADQGVRLVRFEFPYMALRREDGKRLPPNPAPQLLDCWRVVYQQVRAAVQGPLAIGGKSMGGRIASMLADELAVDALVCLGYPFHPAGKPEKLRVSHLLQLRTPSLIVQGERDALGALPEVLSYELPSTIEMHWLNAANHDLKPLKVSGFSHEQHLDTAAGAITAFLGRVVAPD